MIVGSIVAPPSPLDQSVASGPILYFPSPSLGSRRRVGSLRPSSFGLWNTLRSANLDTDTMTTNPEASEDQETG